MFLPVEDNLKQGDQSEREEKEEEEEERGGEGERETASIFCLFGALYCIYSDCHSSFFKSMLSQ